MTDETASEPTGPHVLVVVQNLPVPMDRRVWLECQALVSAGYTVSVVCPRGPGEPMRERLEGVWLYKYPPPPAAAGLLGYLVEFGYCWLRTAALSVVVHRRQPFDVLHACNPPDTYWALARLWRRATRGRLRFLFDHHDLNPEVFLSRFGQPTGPRDRVLLSALRWLEGRTFAAADHVVSTNESYRAVAIARGGLRWEDTTVVRSGPDTAAMRPVRGLPELRRPGRHLAVWLGIMGPQDGVDVVLHALAHYVHTMGRTDLHVALLGFGDSQQALERLAVALDVTDHLTFTGRVDTGQIADWLSSADLALCPDPSNPLNDVSTMNKTMEYMTFALPLVASDLTETRVSAGDAARYVPPGDTVALAEAVAALVDDPAERQRLGVAARRRAAEHLDWGPQAKAYIRAVDSITGWSGESLLPKEWPLAERRSTDQAVTPQSTRGRQLVDLRDDAELAVFARTRLLPGPSA